MANIAERVKIVEKPPEGFMDFVARSNDAFKEIIEGFETKGLPPGTPPQVLAALRYMLSQSQQRTESEIKEAIQRGHLEIARTYQELRKYTYINCWHISEDESASMWSQYAGLGTSFAIQTTYEDLIKSFGGVEEDIIISKVQYGNFLQGVFSIPEGDHYRRFFLKDVSFSHENELRCLYRDPRYSLLQSHEREPLASIGISIPTNIENLIQKIYFAPYGQQWEYDIASDIIRKYGISRELLISRLDHTPYY
ncbi:hypothetical protein DAETH_05830 [Deinococcus aetherius]|uniref:DUF2971 domain-containing protein n=2 Tax=Deinococcus aetherius TaxID=200252 RepID=A0ABM8AAF9_9DEIO|nr:hypothetical protein DAETH_05830 [Deinococcus aetherius]